MKFKWIGGNGFKDIDLVLNKVMKPSDQLFKGTIIDVPDENVSLIRRIKLNANYEVYVEPTPKKKRKFKNKPKKDKTEETKKEIEEEEKEE